MNRTYAERSPSAGNSAWGDAFERLQALELHLTFEFWLYAALVVAAILLRFTDLGTRALHHDESLHATYSWYFFTGKQPYVHDPLMHGPFLFHITALSYLLFGASDASSRFSAALFGSALVMLPLLLRPWMGRAGAFAAAAFLAISPSLLYYSRFIRDDPYVVFFTLGLIVCIFRYLRSAHPGWLYTAALLLSLSFCSMEITYFIALSLLLYLDGLMAADLSAELASNRGWSEARRGLAFAGFLPVAWLLVVLWPVLKRQRDRFDLDALPRSGVLLLVLGLLTAPQFAAAVRVPLKMLGYDLASPADFSLLGQTVTLGGTPLSRVEAVGGFTVILLLLVTLVAGLGWNRRWLLIAACFYVPYFLLYTTFLTNREGWGSGIWGSLSYWLDQQDVQRGRQPVFYFAMTLTTYEYLTMALTSIGIIIQAVRRGFESGALLFLGVCLLPCIAMVNNNFGNRASIPVAVAAAACFTASMAGDRLRQLLVFYFCALFYALSVAGEKMPWLTEHPALPLALLAGLAVQDVFGLLPALLPRLKAATAGAIVAALALAGVAAAALASRGLAGPWKVAALALFVVGTAAAVWALLKVLQASGARRRVVVALGVAGIAALSGFLGVLTLRNDYRMNWVHADVPDEMLIYTQTSPDVPKVKKQIDQLAAESGLGASLPILVDANDAFTWPWAWYLRDYPNTAFIDLSGYMNPAAAQSLMKPNQVVLANAQDQNFAQFVPGYFGAGERYHHRWWFPEEGYRSTTAGLFLSRVKDGSEPRRWWTYVTNRDGLTLPSSDVTPVNASNTARPLAPAPVPDQMQVGSVDSVAYFPSNWLPGKGLVGVPGSTVAPVGAIAARTSGDTLQIGGAPGSGLQSPAGVAADAAGDIYTVESISGVVRKFDRNGTLLAQTSNVDPTTQFQLPWGIAVDREGFVYVADTFNHRIVKLDGSLRYITAWGAYGQGDPSPLKLYGPRSIAFDSAGNLWVTDTGNSRVVEYASSGQPLAVFGGPGTGDGQFQEPVGIAIAPDGTIFVDDTWNNRIQYFDRTFAFLGSFTVNAWVDASGAGQDQNNKPYLAILPDGSILTSFPRDGRIARFDRQGHQLASVSQLPGMSVPLRRPIGVSVTSAGEILLADGVLNELMRLPAASIR